MTLAQGSGAGLGAVLAGVLVTSLQHFVGYTIDLASATAIVTAGIALGGVLVHAVATYGVLGIAGIILHGASGKTAPVAPPPPLPAAVPPPTPGP
jgi:hypothetical protein